MAEVSSVDGGGRLGRLAVSVVLGEAWLSSPQPCSASRNGRFLCPYTRFAYTSTRSGCSPTEIVTFSKPPLGWWRRRKPNLHFSTPFGIRYRCENLAPVLRVQASRANFQRSASQYRLVYARHFVLRISLVVLLASRWPCREPACRSSLRLDFLHSPAMPHSCASRRISPEVLPGTLTAFAAERLSFLVFGENVPHMILKPSILQFQLIPTTKNNPPLFDFDYRLRLSICGSIVKDQYPEGFGAD